MDKQANFSKLTQGTQVKPKFNEGSLNISGKTDSSKLGSQSQKQKYTEKSDSDAQLQEKKDIPKGRIPSPDDKYGLYGLADIVRMSDKDVNMLALGCDFFSPKINPNELSYWKLFSPFVDMQPHSSVYEHPKCAINTHKPQGPIPPAIKKVSLFSEETLFYVFYTLTRDLLQEVAAQELYNRNWRFHKELKLWLSRDESSETVKGLGFERGIFVFFDPGVWSYIKKEWIIYYNQLEEREPINFFSQNKSTAPFPTPEAQEGSI